jgi:hypothetical protein
MKRAWQIYQSGGVTEYVTIPTPWGRMTTLSVRDKNFSKCLKLAWEIEKENAAQAERRVKPIVIALLQKSAVRQQAAKTVHRPEPVFVIP